MPKENAHIHLCILIAKILEKNLYQVPVIERLDSGIHWILNSIGFRRIYSLESIIQALNNWGQEYNNITVITRVAVDPVLKSTPHFGAKKSYSYFWVRIFF